MLFAITLLGYELSNTKLKIVTGYPLKVSGLFSRCFSLRLLSILFVWCRVGAGIQGKLPLLFLHGLTENNVLFCSLLLSMCGC